MSYFAFAAALAVAGASPANAQEARAIGQETTIPFAANGGIRNFEAGPPGSDYVYLQDRTQHWYKVTLTGPCFPDRTQDTIIYRTGPDGRLDRFSTIASRRFPGRTCGITSIVASLPPEGQPGAPKQPG